MADFIRTPAKSMVRIGKSQACSGSAVDLANERHYSVIEISKLWSLSQKTVRRIFENEPGVIVWGHPENGRRRGYRTLRVPETVLQRVHRKLRTQDY